jgi:hypothetical protein
VNDPAMFDINQPLDQLESHRSQLCLQIKTLEISFFEVLIEVLAKKFEYEALNFYIK